MSILKSYLKSLISTTPSPPINSSPVPPAAQINPSSSRSSLLRSLSSASITPPSTINPKESSPSSTPEQHKIYILKSLLLLIIVTAGGLSGGLSYYFIRNYQSRFYHQQFDSMVQDSYLSIKESLYIKLQLNIQLSMSYGLACPTTAHWPNCVFPYQEFYDRSAPLMAASQLDSFLFLPIVKPSQRASFEKFALDYFQNDGNYPNGTGYTSAGPGIYALTPDGQYIPSPNHTNISDYDILVPILELSDVKNMSSLIFYDTHSDKSMGKTIDNMLDCLLNSSDDSTTPMHRHNKCGALTDFIPFFESKYSAIGVPIFPSQNKTEVVGFTGALFSWATVLSSTTRGGWSFMCKIESSTNPIDLIYEVHGGAVKEKTKTPVLRPRDLSDFESYRTKTYIMDEEMFPGETVYTITYYSIEEPAANYLALIACLCCLGVSIFISVNFEIFNTLIKNEVMFRSRLLDSKRVFVRFVSHEIRTPLNTINLGLRVLLENLKALKDINFNSDDSQIIDRLLDECLELVGELDGNSGIAVTILNDFINYDKIETKTFTIERKIVDMWSVVEKTVNLLILQAKEKKVTLRLKSQLLNPSSFRSLIDFEGPNLKNLRVMGDEIKLGQVIRNLVSNALKFSPANGQVSISVHFEPQQAPVPTTRRPWNHTALFDSGSVATEPGPEIVGYLTISVTDSGPGLSIEQQQQLFREGVQFNPNELQGGQGSGLGLWIAREIVSQHGGTIAASSEGLSKGATFSVSLPMILYDAPVIEEPPKPIPSPRATPGNHRTSHIGQRSLSPVSSFDVRERHVLVADDAPSNRKLVCRLLKSRGYICHEAENGLECVQMVMAADYQYEFIVLDSEMPVLDGPSAAQRLRENRCDVIIIGVTGNVLPEDINFFQKQGANAVLPKPLDINLLLEHVHNATRPPV